VAHQLEMNLVDVADVAAQAAKDTGEPGLRDDVVPVQGIAADGRDSVDDVGQTDPPATVDALHPLEHKLVVRRRNEKGHAVDDAGSGVGEQRRREGNVLTDGAEAPVLDVERRTARNRVRRRAGNPADETRAHSGASELANERVIDRGRSGTDEQIEIAPHVGKMLEGFREEERNAVSGADLADPADDAERGRRTLALAGDCKVDQRRHRQPSCLDAAGDPQQYAVLSGDRGQPLPAHALDLVGRNRPAEQRPHEQGGGVAVELVRRHQTPSRSMVAR